jgi:hypothetical protein
MMVDFHVPSRLLMAACCRNMWNSTYVTYLSTYKQKSSVDEIKYTTLKVKTTQQGCICKKFYDMNACR